MIEMLTILVVGASGGIGGAMLAELRRRYPESRLIGTWQSTPPTTVSSSMEHVSSDVEWEQLDATSDEAVSSLLERIGKLDWVLDASGYLHSASGQPEKSLRNVEPEFFIENMKRNVLPTLLLAKHSQTNMKRSGNTVFATLSAKVGSIEDNRLGGWTSYRCSKAALNMAIRNISIEWKRRNPLTCVVALHPGTTATNLSLPFQRNVPEAQLFSVEKTASFLVDRLQQLTPEHTGSFLAFDGEVLPW